MTGAWRLVVSTACTSQPALLRRKSGCLWRYQTFSPNVQHEKALKTTVKQQAAARWLFAKSLKVCAIGANPIWPFHRASVHAFCSVLFCAGVLINFSVCFACLTVWYGPMMTPRR